MKKNDKILAAALVGVGILLLYKKNDIMEAAENIVWDIVSSRRIALLHPAIKDKVIALVNEADKQGVKIRVTDGFRSFAEQNLLYAKGRTTGGNIVTNATAGNSWHNYGLAVDVVPIENGKAVYNNKAAYAIVVKIAKSLGFVWGGDFKTIKDIPHFQMTFGLTLKQLKAAKKDSNGFVILK